MRELKFHEKKLLKQVNFLEWKNTNTAREHLAIAKYGLRDREEYTKYSRIVGKVRKLAEALARLKESDPVRTTITKKLVGRLYSVGVIKNRKLVDCTKVTVSSFCERRLPMVMKRIRMVPSFKDATRFVEHGHVRLGSKVVYDPSTIISKAMEDFVSWVDKSKIKRKIDEFNGELDDFNYV
ncbi:U3 SMALL NUCLEOLAR RIBONUCLEOPROTEIN [Encephalitozoon cuniculi GB-M1]|uniref:U3 SMALL NUCLEOLAR RIBONUCLEOPROTEIN n=2 Tax=Encephalitozoon cuniculi TaxID=6035 RepID=Q8SRU8_ENCCU|nr:U3 small nucleolar ribonucleoprotein protein IMP3 [Encephalitozoon cuniculi GB-M1]AGE95470.1 U3 small nucleolar ribonucleoprotein [Encephalitozoon cuniculi]KMV66189.1 ribosomal protein S4-like protein [Encephalitozoon cuniculi EcunIII-L]UYI27929.1 U3 small nucleolar ribonucleoprotein IMP3 [Encephalitozoon cuniculi]CAD26652.1 U3 SMALL NUCLEOLAR RIBONUCLEOPROTEIN [Encephalitozoon cuniculi GB-M1]